MFDVFTPLAQQAVLEAVQDANRREPVLDSRALRRVLVRFAHVEEVLRGARLASADLLAEPDPSAVVPTSPGAVPFSEGALGAFDRAAARWPSVSTGRLLVTLVDDLALRPDRWPDVAPTLAQLPDPPATTPVSAHQVRLGPP